MVANLCLLTCALVTAQPAERSEWLLFPRLSQGQELVYRGAYTEEALGRDVQFNRSYRLECRLFALGSTARNTNIALYTVFRQRNAPTQSGIQLEPASARLELANIDPHGRLSAGAGVTLATPLEGPATLECGQFVEFPHGRVTLGQSWQVTEENRPPRAWKVIGAEVISNTRCLKLEGVQQSPDFDQFRGERTAWRRRDTIWLPANLGVAYKVERTMERRDQAGQIQRSTVQYELQSNVQYPGRLFEDRRREISEARSFGAALAPMLPNPTRYPARTYDAMLTKIDHHLDHEPRTPYREAILQVKRRVEAARRGDNPPSALEENTESIAAVGQRAPDFVSTNLITKESVRSARFLGRPVVMLFYSPKSTKAEEVLRFAQALQDSERDRIHVVGFAVSDDSAHIQRQCKDFHLTFTILSGKGLRQSYAVEATPKLMVLDANGVVRGSYDGWGPETAPSVTAELKAWLQRKAR
jgi:peroxiredoxin